MSRELISCLCLRNLIVIINTWAGPVGALTSRAFGGGLIDWTRVLTPLPGPGHSESPDLLSSYTPASVSNVKAAEYSGPVVGYSFYTPGLARLSSQPGVLITGSDYTGIERQIGINTERRLSTGRNTIYGLAGLCLPAKNSGNSKQPHWPGSIMAFYYFAKPCLLPTPNLRLIRTQSPRKILHLLSNFRKRIHGKGRLI